MSTERTDRYWLGVKALVGLFVGSFVPYLSVFVYYTLFRDVPTDADLMFETHPLLATLGALSGFVLVLGALPFCYLVSRDKRERARDDPDVNRRHWLTVGALSYFSGGLYPLWYVVARHRRTDATGRTVRGVLAPRLRSAHAALERAGGVARGWYDSLGGRSGDR